LYRYYEVGISTELSNALNLIALIISVHYEAVCHKISLKESLKCEGLDGLDFPRTPKEIAEKI
jgi:hypothetical protein